MEKHEIIIVAFLIGFLLVVILSGVARDAGYEMGVDETLGRTIIAEVEVCSSDKCSEVGVYKVDGKIKIPRGQIEYSLSKLDANALETEGDGE
jgi:hypothetical protein